MHQTIQSKLEYATSKSNLNLMKGKISLLLFDLRFFVDGLVFALFAFLQFILAYL